MRKNHSQKREDIYSELCGTVTHPTAEWIFTRLKSTHPQLSLATVYRNLKEFCAQGKAISVGTINGQEHFDADTRPHSHMVCRQCGAVIDIFETFCDTAGMEALAQKYGVKIDSCEVLLRGVCTECAAMTTGPQ